MTVEKPKPKQLLRPITTGANSAMNQSQFLAIACNSLKPREKSRVHGTICCDFVFHWLKNWHKSFKPITKRRSRNHVISFNSHLKTALMFLNCNPHSSQTGAGAEADAVTTIPHWFMVSARPSSYGCTQEDAKRERRTRVRISQGCLVPFQNCPMFPCSHTFSLFVPRLINLLTVFSSSNY